MTTEMQTELFKELVDSFERGFHLGASMPAETQRGLYLGKSYGDTVYINTDLSCIASEEFAEYMRTISFAEGVKGGRQYQLLHKPPLKKVRHSPPQMQTIQFHNQTLPNNVHLLFAVTPGIDKRNLIDMSFHFCFEVL